MENFLQFASKFYLKAFCLEDAKYVKKCCKIRTFERRAVSHLALIYRYMPYFRVPTVFLRETTTYTIQYKNNVVKKGGYMFLRLNVNSEKPF